nr:PFL2-3: glycyl radical enzyme, PFL2/glycerol dehydratase [uncultured bacterium]
MTLEQMKDALEADFEGYEELRAMLDRMTPAYGNGLEEVDSIADKVLTHFSKSVFELNHNSEKDKYVSTLFGYFFHIYHGEIVGATPNGRHKGEPFSDSMGPGQGKDVKGPTRLLHSVIRLNDDYITGGYALNYKLNPAFLNEEKGRQAAISLLKTYIENRGPQIQVYTTNLDDIKDAQVHPEKHRDLIVRVGGYCEFFVNLDRVLQNEIIARTMYGEG